MSKEAKTRIVQLGTAGKEIVSPELEERARETFHRAVERAGGLALTPDGTLTYEDPFES